MSETRWLVHTLPGSPVSKELGLSGCDLTLSVSTVAEEVVQAVENAARRNGMVIERMAAVTPPRYPETRDE